MIFRKDNWVNTFEKCKKQAKIKYEDIAERMGVSVQTVQKFKNNPPAKREQVIVLAASLGMKSKETNHLLKVAGYSELYDLVDTDATWHYLLDNKKCSLDPKGMYAEYIAGLNKLRNKEIQIGENAPVNYNPETVIAELGLRRAIASNRNRALLGLESKNVDGVDYEYLSYIQSRYSANEHINRKLKRTIDFYIQTYGLTPNMLFDQYHLFKKRYYETMQKLEQENIIPSRRFLLALGIHLDLTVRDMNEILANAKMALLNENDSDEKRIFDCMEECYEGEKTVIEIIKTRIDEDRNYLSEELIKQLGFGE